MEFSKELSQTDVTSKFVVKEEWLGTLLPGNLRPGSMANILVVDNSGNEFTFILKLRNFDVNRPGAYYPKPEFMARGWHDFVRQKGLENGQTIFFSRVGEGHIRVHID